MFNLGPNSTLVLNNLTNVVDDIKAMDLEAWPMVSSYPYAFIHLSRLEYSILFKSLRGNFQSFLRRYPPQFLDWMRQVFANPEPFFEACVAA
jgi:hypothetical protein